MNKFGIFNLLNSFFSLSSNLNSKSQGENNTNLDFLTNLFSQNSSITPSPLPEQKKQEIVQAVPLQQGMLLTMKSHDDFVKRVKKQNL